MSNDKISDPGEIAAEKFGSGFNCAQAVFSAFASCYGMDEAAALKLASLFGGGVARRGQVCGAVTGALLALGLGRGPDTPGAKEEACRLGQEFLQKFETRHRAILCRDLIGYDPSQPESREQARRAGRFKAQCPRFVRDAAEIVREMLDSAGD